MPRDTTTLGRHIHLTYGWRLIHDDPGSKVSALLTPGGSLATVYLTDDCVWVVAIWRGNDWDTCEVFSSDDVQHFYASGGG